MAPIKLTSADCTASRPLIAALLLVAALDATGCNPICGARNAPSIGICIETEDDTGGGDERADDTDDTDDDGDNDGGDDDGAEGGGDGEGEGEGDPSQAPRCGSGTVELDGVCVPACRVDQVLVDGSCTCPAGQRDVDGACIVDPARCGPGTVLSGDGTCVPSGPSPANDDDSAGPIQFPLPAAGTDFVAGGVLDVPGEGNGLDTFSFSVPAAGTRVRIQVYAFGADDPAFVVEGADSSAGHPAYVRTGLLDEGRRAMRELVLPEAGTYRIHVGDAATFTGGIARGGPGQTYDLIVSALAPAEPITLRAGVAITGRLEVVTAARLEPVSAGAITQLALAADPGASPVFWFTDEAGAYRELPARPAPFVRQTSGGRVVHVDATVTGRSPGAYALEALPPLDAPVPAVGGPAIDVDLAGRPAAFLPLDPRPSSVTRARVTLPLAGARVESVAVVGPGLQPCGSTSERVAADGRAVIESLCFVDEDDVGPFFLAVVLDQTRPAVNDQLRIAVAEAPVFDIEMAIDDVFVLTLDADEEDDDFGAPWRRLRYLDAMAVSMTDVGNRFPIIDFHQRDMLRVSSQLVGNLFADATEQVAGFDVLLHARGRRSAVEFVGLPLGYPMELEPANDLPSAADVLPAEPAPGLASLFAAAGRLVPGDVDHWSITTTQAGTVVVAATNPALAQDVPFDALFQAFGAEPNARVLLQFVDEQGQPLSNLAPEARAFLPAGRHLIRAVLDEDSATGGDYALGFRVATTLPPPPAPSCASPRPLGTGETLGNLAEGVRVGAAAPGSTCAGIAVSGADAVADAWSLEVPASTRVTVSLEPRDTFDAGLLVLDATGASGCNGACLAGALAPAGSSATVTLEATDAPRTLRVLVRPESASSGSYRLRVALLGDACTVGDTRCSAAGNVERCVDGRSFVAQDPCPNGCAVDPFDRVARCDLRCGDGAVDVTGAPMPDVICLGRRLFFCPNEGGQYITSDCAVACATDEDGTSGRCTLGVCDPFVPSSCVEDAAGHGIVSTCGDAGGVGRDQSCVAGCADSFSCALPEAGAGDPVAAPSICDATDNRCEDDLATACSGDGTALTTERCASGCGATGCAVPTFGESCADPLVLPLPPVGGSSSVTAELASLDDDVALLCGVDPRPEGVVAFAASEPRVITIVVEAATPVRVAIGEDSCPTASASQFACLETSPQEPFAFSLFASAGSSYFVIVEGADAGPVLVALVDEVF